MEQLKILVFEGDESKKLMLSMFFEELGVSKGVSFININLIDDSLLKNSLYDLVIVDLNDSEIAPEEVLAIIRRKGEGGFLSNRPVILIKEKLDADYYTNPKFLDVYYLSSILNFEKLNLLIKQLVNTSIKIDYLYEIAEIGKPDPESLINKLFTSFKVIVPSKLKEIEDLFFKNDQEGISRAAHSLRSTCYNIGAHYLADLLKELEEEARDGNLKLDFRHWEKIIEHHYDMAVYSLDKIILEKKYLKS